jgi:hypothetical protein
MFCEFLVFKKSFQKTLLRDIQKYLAKKANWTQLASSRHCGIANALERVKRMKSELQLADSLAQIFVQTKII